VAVASKAAHGGGRVEGGSLLQRIQHFDWDDWLVRRFVWDVPIRPDYIPIPPIPGAGNVKAVRWLALATLLWLGASLFVCTATAHALSRDHFPIGAPFIGPFYSLPSAWDWVITFSHGRSAFAEPILVHLATWLAIWMGVCGIVASPIMAIEPIIPKRYQGVKPHTDWASMADYAAAKLLDHSQPGVTCGAALPPMVLGIYQPRPRLLVYPGPRHVIANAASRSGKDVMIVDFTEVMSAGGYSMVINSPKGDDYVKNSGVAKHYWGCNVYRFSPGSPEVGNVFRDSDGNERIEQFGCSPHNLFDEVDWGTDNEYWQLLQIWTGIVAKSPKDLDGENGHWYRGSRVIGKAVSYKTVYDPLETWRSPSRVADLLSGAVDPGSEEHEALRKSSDDKPAATDSIHDVIEHYIGFSATGWGSKPTWLLRAVEEMRTRAEHEIILKRKEIGRSLSEADCFSWEIQRRKKLDRDTRHLETQMRHPDMERDLRNVMRIKGDEAGSMYSTINARLTVWLDPSVIRNTRVSSWTWTGLKNGPRPSRLWVVNPLDRADMFYDIIRVEYDFALRKLYPEMKVDLATKKAESPHKWPCIWMMNELGQVGDLPQIKITVPVMAAYKDIFVSLFQTAGQEEEQFGEHSIITPNSGVQIFHTPQSYDDAKELSESLGVRMILTEDEQWSGAQRSKSIKAENVPLMDPAQVQAMPSEARWQEDRAGNILYDATGSPVRCTRRAYQIVRAPNMPPGYSLKVQSFFKGDFPAVHGLIGAFDPVLPDRTLLKRTHVEAEAARLQATRETVKRETYQPETALRSMSRLNEAVRLLTITPAEAAAIAGKSPAAAAPAAASQARTAAPGAVRRRRSLKVKSMSERVVPRRTSSEPSVLQKTLPSSFEQFEG
jgi:hypothetical protein